MLQVDETKAEQDNVGKSLESYEFKESNAENQNTRYNL